MSKRELPPLIWQPVERYVGCEAYPGCGSRSPEEWITRDKAGAPAMLYWSGTGLDGKEEVSCRPFEDGEEVEFLIDRHWGEAVLTIRPDGAWSIDREPPPETNLFVTDNHMGFAETLEKLAEIRLRLHTELHAMPTLRLPEISDEEHARREQERLDALAGDVIQTINFVREEGCLTLIFRADPPRFERPAGEPVTA